MSGDGSMPPDLGPLVDVRLVGLPIDVQIRVSAWHDALQREFAIIRAGDPEGDSVPSRLITLLEDLQQRYSGLNDTQADLFQAALERGDETIDLDMTIPAIAADAVRQLDDLLHEADDYCRQGEHLLTLATPPEGVAYRRWFLQEFVNQIAGEAATSWADYVRDHPIEPDSRGADAVDIERTTNRTMPTGWFALGPSERPTLIVDGPLDLDTAPRLRDALQDLRAGGAQDIAVDMRQVGFVDSVALSVLVAAHRRLADEGASMEVNVPQRMMRLLEITGLDDVLDVRSSNT